MEWEVRERERGGSEDSEGSRWRVVLNKWVLVSCSDMNGAGDTHVHRCVGLLCASFSDVTQSSCVKSKLLWGP
jgi:hypothetical protein